MKSPELAEAQAEALARGRVGAGRLGCEGCVATPPCPIALTGRRGAIDR
jgi:hypothetical protein